jgi:uncharacterized tellurite resistance protein B-like protein
VRGAPFSTRRSSCTATAPIDRIFDAADAFTAGAPQHDGMTVIVVRVTSGACARSRSRTRPAGSTHESCAQVRLGIRQGAFDPKRIARASERERAATMAAQEAKMGLLETLGWRAQATPATSQADTEAVRRISAALDALEPDRARYVAAFAFLLSRVALADLSISAEETRAMERIVHDKGGLPEAQAVIVVQMAKTQNILFGGVENFLVTREFRDIASREQKLALLHCLFAVSAADRSISSAEETTIRKIGSELLLDHADYVEVKAAYRDHLATLKDPGA